LTEAVHSLGGEITSNANELHFLMGFRTNHPRENNNYLFVELGAALIQFEDRFNEEREAWNDKGGTAVGATVQGGVVFALSPRWGLDLSGILMVRPTLIEDSADPGLLFGINLGLAYRW
jgi:hypothetical protein